MSELASSKEPIISSPLIEKTTRFLNGQRPAVPEGYLSREEFEKTVCQRTIEAGANACLVLVDIRQMSRLDENWGNKHLLAIKLTIADWGREKNTLLFTAENSDEILIFLADAGQNEIKASLQELYLSIQDATRREINHSLAQNRIPIISQGAVIIQGNGKSLNSRSLSRRLKEADQLLQKAKTENLQALVSVDEIDPQFSDSRDLKEIEVLSPNNGWQKTNLKLGKESFAIQAPPLPSAVISTASQARQKLAEFIKPNGLSAVILSITNFWLVNKKGQEFGDQVLAAVASESLEQISSFIIKMGTDFLIVFLDQKPNEDDLSQKIAAIRRKMVSLTTAQGLAENKVNLYSLRVQITQNHQGKLQLTKE